MSRTKNTLEDLNNHLFATLERLNDDELMKEDADMEIKKAKAITDVSEQIINNANLALKAEEFKAEYGLKSSGVKMIEVDQ